MEYSRVFNSPFLLLLLSWWHAGPNDRPQRIMSGCGFESLWVAPLDHTYPFGGFFRSTEWTSWILSMNLTNFNPHRHSNGRQYGILATRPDLCASWSRQCTSVVLGMILLRARRVELEVRRDDDKWNLLQSTRSHCEFVCRLRPFRVSLKFFSDIFTPCKLFPPWSGFSDSIISSKQFCCSICDREYNLFTLFWALLPLLHWASEHGYPTRPTCPAPQCLRPKYLLSRFTSRTMHVRGIFQVKLSCQTGGVLTGLRQKYDDDILSLHGSPNRVSWGVFPSDKRSCTFCR